MPLNRRCPKCNSTRVALTVQQSKHGCLFFFLFGLYYLAWYFVRCGIGFILFLTLDWWLALLKYAQGKSYVWKSKRWFSNRRRYYYCHECGHNFKG